MNKSDFILPPPPTEKQEAVWAKIYVDSEGYSEVTDRAGIAIDQFECYAHALEFVRFNHMRLKTVHRFSASGGGTFLHLVGE